MVHIIIIVEKNVFYMCICRIKSKSVDYCHFFIYKVLSNEFSQVRCVDVSRWFRFR